MPSVPSVPTALQRVVAPFLALRSLGQVILGNDDCPRSLAILSNWACASLATSSLLSVLSDPQPANSAAARRSVRVRAAERRSVAVMRPGFHARGARPATPLGGP